MSSIKARVEALERATPPPPPDGPRVILWLPRKDDGSGPPLGDTLSADGQVLTRIYDLGPYNYVTGRYEPSEPPATQTPE